MKYIAEFRRVTGRRPTVSHLMAKAVAMVMAVARAARKRGLRTTMGGSINAGTIVLLQGDAIGGAVFQPGIEHRQQRQRGDQQHQQAAAQAGGHPGSLARAPAAAGLHSGAVWRSSSR